MAATASTCAASTVSSTVELRAVWLWAEKARPALEGVSGMRWPNEEWLRGKPPGPPGVAQPPPLLVAKPPFEAKPLFVEKAPFVEKLLEPFEASVATLVGIAAAVKSGGRTSTHCLPSSTRRPILMDEPANRALRSFSRKN